MRALDNENRGCPGTKIRILTWQAHTRNRFLPGNGDEGAQAIALSESSETSPLTSVGSTGASWRSCSGEEGVNAHVLIRGEEGTPGPWDGWASGGCVLRGMMNFYGWDAVRVEAASRLHGEPSVALQVAGAGAMPLQRGRRRVFSCVRASRAVPERRGVGRGVHDVWVAWRAFSVFEGHTKLRLVVTPDPTRGEVRFRLARPGPVLRRVEGAWRVKGFTGVVRHEGGALEVLEESSVSLSCTLRLARPFTPFQPLVGVAAAKAVERACEDLAAEMRRPAEDIARNLERTADGVNTLFLEDPVERWWTAS